MSLNLQISHETVSHSPQPPYWRLSLATPHEGIYSGEIRCDRQLATHKKKERVSRIETTSSQYNSQTLDICSPLGVSLDFGLSRFTKRIVDGYSGKTTYVMGSINSIALHNNLIYDLLDPTDAKSKKTLVRCRCTQSKCKAGYCQCYSRGLSCGIICQCLNCQNTVGSEPSFVVEQEEKGCRCQRSHCGKKYCQCLKEGNKCTDKCQCIECHNI